MRSAICCGVGRSMCPDQFPVGEEQHTIGVRRGHRVVRDHDDGLIELGGCPAQQLQNLLGAAGVEGARRLVGKECVGVGDEGARDGDALLLTTGQFGGFALAVRSESDGFEDEGQVLLVGSSSGEQ